MYCPQCGAQNTDDTKYCRACGTNLGVVSLALTNPDQLVAAALGSKGKDWLTKRREGITTLIKASGLVGASALVGVLLGVFSNTNDWIFVWLGLASWMACWGIILWSQGINALIESRFMRRELQNPSKEKTERTNRELASGGGRALDPANLETSATTKLAQSSSVTENTTELLNK